MAVSKDLGRVHTMGTSEGHGLKAADVVCGQIMSQNETVMA